MSTTPNAPGATTPTLPLSPDARAAYEDLYAKTQSAIENTADGGLLQSLNATQLAIGGVLSADDEYRLTLDTARFNALLGKINSANDALTDLQTQIAGVASEIAVFGDVAGGIAKVLTLVPGA